MLRATFPGFEVLITSSEFSLQTGGNASVLFVLQMVTMSWDISKYSVGMETAGEGMIIKSYCSLALLLSTPIYDIKVIYLWQPWFGCFHPLD